MKKLICAMCCVFMMVSIASAVTVTVHYSDGTMDSFMLDAKGITVDQTGNIELNAAAPGPVACPPNAPYPHNQPRVSGVTVTPVSGSGGTP